MEMTTILYAVAALGGLGITFGVLLTIADKLFAVRVDDRVERIRQALPGANCGACGYVGCDAFAEDVAKGEAKLNGCVPGGKKCAAEIAEIMGTDAGEESKPMVAKVVCQGQTGISRQRYEYAGYRSCRMASSMVGGPKKCQYACVGLGDCVAACKFDALVVENGLAKVDASKCTACGMCEKACPRRSIQLLPVENTVLVHCQNQDAARAAREVCMKACLGCGRCVKECKFEAIEVRDGFAHIDLKKCTRCGDCAKVCPAGCIMVA